MWIASRTLPRSVSLPVLTKRLGPSPLPGLGLSGLLGGADKKWAIPTPQRGVPKKGAWEQARGGRQAGRGGGRTQTTKALVGHTPRNSLFGPKTLLYLIPSCDPPTPSGAGRASSV